MTLGENGLKHPEGEALRRKTACCISAKSWVQVPRAHIKTQVEERTPVIPAQLEVEFHSTSDDSEDTSTLPKWDNQVVLLLSYLVYRTFVTAQAN